MNQISTDTIYEFIFYSFKINSNSQNEYCTVHKFLHDVHKRVHDDKNEVYKIKAFKDFCTNNIFLFFVIENYFSKGKFEQVADVKSTYNGS